MKITKEQFDKLYSDDITKKEYNSTIEHIDVRLEKIIITLLPEMRKRGGWYDYGNCDPDSEISGGHFDPHYCEKYIDLHVYLDSRYREAAKIFEVLGDVFSIPTKWLWEEDFKEQYDILVEDHDIEIEVKKAKAKKKKEAKDKRLYDLKKSIEKKLTKEELSAITFKKV